MKPLKGDIAKLAKALPDKVIAPIVRKTIAKAHDVSKKPLRKQKWVA